MSEEKEALLRELGNLLDAEVQIAQLVSQRSQEVRGAEVYRAFQQHALTTQQEVRNLERCFSVLDAVPRYTTCLAIERWKKGHDRFLRTRAWPADCITMFDLTEARRIGRYKIASYQRVIKQAETLGEDACVRLLRQNLCQEELMVKKVAHFSQELAPQLRPE